MWMGRPFSFAAEVVAGDKRGRLLGTPTVNQKLPDDLVIPRYGVYVSEVRFGGSICTGVTNIGARPTFQAPEVRSETFILDFDGDLYGQTVETALVKYLRPVMTFDSADAPPKRPQLAAPGIGSPCTTKGAAWASRKTSPLPAAAAPPCIILSGTSIRLALFWFMKASAVV